MLKINKTGWIVDALFLMAVIFIFIISNYAEIKYSTLEIGDYAANSILIQDAKTFDLNVGNYSRLGFNHPGPAILYVLAAGEVLFYDLIGCVNSPIAGQLVAANMYNAIWILFIFKLMILIFKSNSIGFFSTCLFLCISSILDFRVFTGIWMPHMYYFPFATMLLAFASISSREICVWAVFALSMGFLINGHVSFIAIIGVMLILLSLGRFVSLHKSHSMWAIVRRDLNEYSVNLLVFCGVVLIFLVPIATETVMSFPGPISQYYKYGSTGRFNDLSESLGFVSHYWGGLWMMLIGGFIIITHCTYVVKSKKTVMHAYLCSLTVLFCSTVAFLIYAVKGVDHLDQFYIGIFYYSVPALFAVMVVSWYIKAIDRRHYLVLFLAFLLTCVTLMNINKKVDYAESYNHPEILNIYGGLNNFKRDGRLVLDLKTDGNWPNVWSNIVGVLLHAIRERNDFFCINQGWHILFTNRYKCSETEVAFGKRLQVFDLRDVDVANLKDYFSVGNIAIAIAEPFYVNMNEYLPVSSQADLFAKYVLISGWSGIEKEFVWTNDYNSRLRVPLPKQFVGYVILDVEAYLPGPDSSQEVTIDINGLCNPSEFFSAERNRRVLKYFVENKDGNGVVLALKVKRPISPLDFGSNDNRKLGVALYGIQASDN